MKIRSANIRNFKLLRNLDLEFSLDRDKPLTVIRAENGSGKTSTLQALRWALYGKQVLEDPNVRLSPADWPDNEVCRISVSIKFDHSAISKVAGENRVLQTSYILKREVDEKPQGDYPHRGKEAVSLFDLTPPGAVSLKNPVSKLNQLLPEQMMDIFFTDGDKAMSFISAKLPEDVKRTKVKDAIRSLLGLDLLEEVEKRVSAMQSTLDGRVYKDTKSKELKDVTKEIDEANKLKEEFEKKIADRKSQIANIEKKLEQVEHELNEALEAGNFKHLSRQRKNYEDQLEQARGEEKKLKGAHQELFQKETLCWDLIGSLLRKGFKQLDEIHKKGTIPGEALPILREQLELERCICGASLEEGTQSRENVKKLIQEHQESKGKFSYLTDLYFCAKGELDKQQAADKTGWKGEFRKFLKRRTGCEKNIEKLDQELKFVAKDIAKIDQRNIEKKVEWKKAYESMIHKNNQELAETTVALDSENKRLEKLKPEHKKLLQADKKMIGHKAEYTVLSDLRQVVTGALEEIEGTYIKRVSDCTNGLFLEMVGADADADAGQDKIFQGVKIDDEYSIIVKTKDGRTLHPDYEVNAASQRALTFAFIWALTEVSGVVSPRVIDTPLGMMSGNVKRRVLEMVSKAVGEEVDRQVILFLTQSEILHAEDILDERSGKTVTLIKTDDYPKDLKNDPRADLPVVLACECTHRQFCDQCQRNNYEDYKLVYRSA